jgi:hypothetical protein
VEASCWPSLLGSYNRTLIYQHLDDTFFISEVEYTGFGPVSICRGDRIAVFCCGKNVYALQTAKRGKGTYYLFGDAYVDGIITGGMFERAMQPGIHIE